MVASNAASLTLMGISDSTEPYSWLPTNAVQVQAFRTVLLGLANRSLAVTFNDNSTTSAAHTVDAGGVSWAFDIPEPTVTHDSPPQMLSDWDDTGLEVEAAARIVASGNPTLYADSDRGGTDTPAEGELGLGAGETVISRIRCLGSGARFSLNNNDNPVPLSMRDFLGSPNSISEWTLYVQLEDGTLVTSNQLAATTNDRANYAIADSDDQAALNSIASGDSLIVAIARTAPLAVAHEVDAGGVSWAFTIAEPTATKVEPDAHEVDAGGVSMDIRHPRANGYEERTECSCSRCRRSLLDIRYPRTYGYALPPCANQPRC